MLVNTEIRVTCPNANHVVFYKYWQGKDERKKAYPVIINSGNFEVNGRISNFWRWQRISPTGRINPNVESGYGNFTEAEGYEVTRKIKIT